MNAYVGRLRNVRSPAQLLGKSIFSNTFGTILKNLKKQLIKHRELGTKLPPQKSNTKAKREGATPNGIGFLAQQTPVINEIIIAYF